MADRYEKLRAALDSGPALGEWISRKDGRFMNMDGWSAGHEDHTFSAAAPIKAGGEVIAIVVDGRDEFNQEMAELKANADYIAAANPETIRALLAERDALRVALEDELIWHEAQDKAISKQPNANTGHNWWRRAQHQEHAVVIRAALGQGQGGSDGNQD